MHWGIFPSALTHTTHRRNKMFKTPQEWADAFKSMTPQVTVNKNGYEIRTDLLGMAKEIVWQDYTARWGQFEVSATKDGDSFTTKVELPTVPGVENVLAVAEKLYDFVNNKK